MQASEPSASPPITKETIIDLRRRVLANLPVSDEELADALRHMCRSAPDDVGKPAAAQPKVKIDVMGLLRARVAAKSTEA